MPVGRGGGGGVCVCVVITVFIIVMNTYLSNYHSYLLYSVTLGSSCYLNLYIIYKLC